MKYPLLLLALIAFPAFESTAQTTIKDYRDKVQTLDGIIATLYDVISGEKGEPRDWELFKYLFWEEARLIPTRMDQEGRVMPNFWSPDDYVERAGSFLEESGFFEKEIHRVVESFGPVTHVFSTYESYRSASDKEPFARGINSIQLLQDGKRWWVVNIYWSAESADNPIPEKYLPEE